MLTTISLCTIVPTTNRAFSADDAATGWGLWVNHDRTGITDKGVLCDRRLA